MKVKICGITNIDDALCAIGEGAAMLGFVFAKSPRRISESECASILNELNIKGIRSKVKTAGVFVNESAEQMKRILLSTGLDFAQIHGDESADICKGFDFDWYRVLRIKDKESFERTSNEVSKLQCNMIFADTLSSKGYGGTGELIDAEISSALREKVHAVKKEFFIAGGITPENVASVITSVNPDGIDVASGVEESPGKKSHKKIRELFMAVRLLK